MVAPKQYYYGYEENVYHISLTDCYQFPNGTKLNPDSIAGRELNGHNQRREATYQETGRE